MSASAGRESENRAQEKVPFDAHPLAVAVDLATRIVRLVTWLAMYFAVCLMLWILLKTNAEAAGPQENPQAAARAIGQAGANAAGLIARDAESAAGVPGFAGTSLPERNIPEAGLEDAARARLANPDDPGGVAGRALVRGRAVRPAAPNLDDDAGLLRADRIQDAPQDSVWRADGIGSGATSECGAEVEDAGRGGTCGGVSWCVGADCGSAPARSNTGFVRAAANLNMVLEMGGSEFDRGNMQFFPGEYRACNVRYGGLRDCCDDSGLFTDLGHCPAHEVDLAIDRDAGRTHYLGEHCARRVLGVCVRRERSWCVFGSKLGLLLHEQARPWLGIGWNTCRGFAVDEIERIDFDDVDLSGFVRELNDPAREPGVDLPARDDVRDDMRQRVRELAGDGQ